MSNAVLQEAVTRRQRLAYRRRVRNAQRALGRLEDRSSLLVRKAMAQAKRNLIGSIEFASGDFEQWFLPQMLDAVKTASIDYQHSLAGTMLDATTSAAELGGARAAASAQAIGINIPGVPIGVPHQPLQLAAQLIPEFVQGESKLVLDSIARTLRLSMAGGLTKAEMTARVKSKLTKVLSFKGKQSRAEAIVRTEVHRVHNAAHLEGAKRLETENVKVFKVWVAADDHRTRPEHNIMDGRRVEVGKRFPYPGLPKSRWPMYPLDPVLPAGQSINCRCTMIEEFEVTE